MRLRELAGAIPGIGDFYVIREAGVGRPGLSPADSFVLAAAEAKRTELSYLADTLAAVPQYCCLLFEQLEQNGVAVAGPDCGNWQLTLVDTYLAHHPSLVPLAQTGGWRGSSNHWHDYEAPKCFGMRWRIADKNDLIAVPLKSSTGHSGAVEKVLLLFEDDELCLRTVDAHAKEMSLDYWRNPAQSSVPFRKISPGNYA